MNKKYLTPSIKSLFIEVESHIAVGSNPSSKDDSFSIGDGDSKHPEDGLIKDDTGDGPGVSGAKENGFSSSWLD